jgi:hypothetical protein
VSVGEGAAGGGSTATSEGLGLERNFAGPRSGRSRLRRAIICLSSAGNIEFSLNTGHYALRDSARTLFAQRRPARVPVMHLRARTGRRGRKGA